MQELKVIYQNGDEVATRINATPEEAIAYYLGKTFNIGTAERDNLQRVEAVVLYDESGKAYTVEQLAGARWYVTSETNNGKKIIIEFCKNTTPEKLTKNSMMYLWKKNGYIKEILPDYWTIHTYVYDDSGDCWGWYNPTIKDSADGKRFVTNFDWLLEATEENARKLFGEVERMARDGIKILANDGKSAA